MGKFRNMSTFVKFLQVQGYLTRHLKFGYILFFTNLLHTTNEMKLNYAQLGQLKKIKRTKSRLEINIKIL